MSQKIVKGPMIMTVDDHHITVEVKTFALSIAASRRLDIENSLADHKALCAPHHIVDEESAREYGLEEAKKQWPIKDGWTHDVAVTMVPFRFEFDK